MSITADHVKNIRQEFARLKPATVTLDGNSTLTVKQAILALAPTLERMKKRGFEMTEIIEKLHEKGIKIKAPTLTKYLAEARRQREGRKVRKQDTPPPPVKATPAPKSDRPTPVSAGSFVITLDTSLDEL